MRYFIIATALTGIVAGLLAPGAVMALDCPTPASPTFSKGADHCLAVKTVAPGPEGGTLAVVLHGNLSRRGPADYIIPVAEMVAERGAAALVLARPGYTVDGRSSTGVASRDQDRTQLYTAAEIDRIGVAVVNLKAFHGADQVVLIGHSGGAVAAGVLLGRRPDLVNGVLLISCPCDVPTWRASRGRAPWPVAASPHRELSNVAAGARIVALGGSDDSNTRPSLARDYVAAAREQGLDAHFILLDGVGHKINHWFLAKDGLTEAMNIVLAPR